MEFGDFHSGVIFVNVRPSDSPLLWQLSSLPLPEDDHILGRSLGDHAPLQKFSSGKIRYETTKLAPRINTSLSSIIFLSAFSKIGF